MYKPYNLFTHQAEVQVSDMKALVNFGDISQTAEEIIKISMWCG